MTPDSKMTNCPKMLRVDLASGGWSVEAVPISDVELLVGGRGLAAACLYRELRPGVDPLGPENKLILTAGVLSGTSAQGFSRWIAVTKSPLTGGFMRSVGGGDFGAFIRFAGYDLILIEGAAPRLSYLLIEPSGVKVMDGSGLAGLDTQATQQRLAERHGSGVRVACIGPAGEQLARFATITHGRRTAARGGVGTVMGSKLLKAVVLAGGPRPATSRPDQFSELVRRQIAILKEHPRRKQMTELGTTAMTEVSCYMGCFPVKNFQGGGLPGVEGLFAENYSKMKVGNFGCYSCMTRCGQVHRVPGGPFSGAFSEGPEYETIWSFGGQVGNVDPAAAVEADARCDLLGLDTISAGNAIGFACELTERGLLSASEGMVSHVEPRWGDNRAILDLVEAIAHRRGLGDLLAEGVRRAAQIIGGGTGYYAMHCKGLELPGYDPRAIKGYALSYATSNIGGSHMYGRPRAEIYGSMDRFAETGKGEPIARSQIQQASDEVAVVCNFGSSGLTQELLAALLAAATGRDEIQDPGFLERVGERILCLERSFNCREGFSRTDDTLPQRMFREPLGEAGPSTGQSVRNLDGMLDEYYQFLGYTAGGVPSAERVNQLGLTGLQLGLAGQEPAKVG